MKKFLLILLIVVLGTFIYLKVQVSGDINSNFNRTTRYTLGKYALARQILGLHNYGDARNWYLSDDGGIILEVVQTRSSEINEQTLNNFADDIRTYTGKKVTIFNTEQMPEGTLSDAELEKAVAGYRHHTVDGLANLFVVYATDFEHSDKAVAKTYNEYAIVLSDKRLKEVSADFPSSLSQYVESTLLHEFGHQLGLEHNSQSRCIMNETVENPVPQGMFDGYYTPTKFCDFELNQLNTIKALSK